MRFGLGSGLGWCHVRADVRFRLKSRKVLFYYKQIPIQNSQDFTRKSERDRSSSNLRASDREAANHEGSFVHVIMVVHAYDLWLKYNNMWPKIHARNR